MFGVCLSNSSMLLATQHVKRLEGLLKARPWLVLVQTLKTLKTFQILFDQEVFEITLLKCFEKDAAASCNLVYRDRHLLQAPWLGSLGIRPLAACQPETQASPPCSLPMRPTRLQRTFSLGLPA